MIENVLTGLHCQGLVRTRPLPLPATVPPQFIWRLSVSKPWSLSTKPGPLLAALLLLGQYRNARKGAQSSFEVVRTMHRHAVDILRKQVPSGMRRKLVKRFFAFLCTYQRYFQVVYEGFGGCGLLAELQLQAWPSSVGAPERCCNPSSSGLACTRDRSPAPSYPCGCQYERYGNPRTTSMV